MPTPTASPTVSSTIGLKNVVIAPLEVDTEETLTYPVDRLMHDIALTLMAVQTQTTSILSEFPTKAAPDQPKPTTETNPETTPKNETAI